MCRAFFFVSDAVAVNNDYDDEIAKDACWLSSGWDYVMILISKTDNEIAIITC